LRILIVEDEKDLAMILSELIEMDGYYTDVAYDGESGLDNAMTGIYDLILLDVMLPVMDGIEVLSKLRENNINTPVLMLTAKSEIDDKVCGLDNGADDYLTKPFNSKELLARIRALLRRKEKTLVEENISFADIKLDKLTHEVTKDSKKIKLSKKEYDLIELLILNYGKVVSKENLVIKIWGYDTDVEYNSIEVYVSFLRKKLKAVGSQIHISTARGLGYTIKESKNG